MKYMGSKNRIANEMKLHIKRLKNFLNFLLQILNRLTVVALAYNVPKIGEVGDFGDEIINRSLSPQSCQSYVSRSFLLLNYLK